MRVCVVDARGAARGDIAGAAKVGKHKPSLQDVEAGRDPEFDALVGAVIELGRATGVPTPHIDTACAPLKLLGRTCKRSRLDSRAAVRLSAAGSAGH